MKKLFLLGTTLYLSFLATQSQAAYVGMASFEPFTKWYWGSLTCTSQNTINAGTGYAFKCAGASSQEGTLFFRDTTMVSSTVSSLATIAGCFDFYSSAQSAAHTILEFHDNTAAYAGHIRDNSGMLEFCPTLSCTSPISGSAGTMTASTWHRICFSYKISVDDFYLWIDEHIDGTPDISSTNVAVSATNVGDVKVHSSNFAAAVDHYYDNAVFKNADIYPGSDDEGAVDLYHTSGAAVTEFNGRRGGVIGLTSNADNVQACTGFTGGNPSDTVVQTNCGACTTTDSYKCANQDFCGEPGADASYIRLTGSTDKEIWGFANTNGVDTTGSPPVDDVYAVLSHVYMRSNGGTAGTNDFKLGTASSACHSASIVETTSYADYNYLNTSDPVTTNAWLSGGLDSINMGIVRTNGSNTFRIETQSLEFAYSVGVTVASVGSNNVMWFTFKKFFDTDSVRDNIAWALGLEKDNNDALAYSRG